jgi:hypothetical protein
MSGIKYFYTGAYAVIIFLFLCYRVDAQENKNSSVKKGIASLFPDDQGIENHKSVIFAEDFEGGSMVKILQNWTWNQGAEDHRLSLDTLTGPDGSAGNKSLKMTILRNKGGSGSDLRKIFNKGYDQLYFRFYVKFAEDYGFNHHFTSLSGDLNPTPWAKGRAGLKPVEHFSATIDQLTSNPNKTGVGHSPPGYWAFYSYWPAMKSWQTPEGNSDGRPNAFYGNIFMPQNPIPAARGKWQCVEIMIRLNSAPGKKDGALAFWINGKPTGRWDPKDANPVKGYWMQEVFRSDPDNEKAQPFPGIEWRTDPEHFDKLKINIIRLQNYVSDKSWEYGEKYAEEHPNFNINLREATVWQDNIVVATEYIGPVERMK